MGKNMLLLKILVKGWMGDDDGPCTSEDRAFMGEVYCCSLKWFLCLVKVALEGKVMVIENIGGVAKYMTC